MYAERGNAVPETAPPIEPVSSVNQNTMSILSDANESLEALLAKVRGNQPSKVNGIEKMPERHMLSDARNARDIAGQIFDKAQELHRYIGHDK